MARKALRPVLLSLLLAASGSGIAASPGSMAVIQAPADEPVPNSFDRMIASMEELPDVEVIRLELDDAQGAAFAAQMLRAANQAGGPGAIAVIYPDIGEPYRSVFTRMIEGIEEKVRFKVASYAVGSNFDPLALSGELKKQEVRVVIALGRNGLKAAAGLDRDIGVVAGGVVAVPENAQGCARVLSLAPDPDLLFARLKALAPATRRVFAVFDPRQNGWLMALARDAARRQGMELVAREAPNLNTAVGLYQEFFALADSREDALWLPQDTVTVEEGTVLPLVFQESWNRRLPVFSSSIAHVKRGALFALYPNNVELGRKLALSALGIAAGGAPAPEVQPLRDVLTAFNSRTAGHLGLVVPALQEQAFDLVFPER